MSDIKLIGFDLDGTLITNNSWNDLNRAMGITFEEDEAMHQAHLMGDLVYEEWLGRLAFLYKKHGRASRENITNSLNEYYLRDGVRETIATLKARGYQTVVVSGASDLMIEIIKNDLGLDYAFTNNTFVFNDEDFLSDIKTLGLDTTAKEVLLRSLCVNLHIDITECIYVGDGHNDLGIFQATGQGVTFKGTVIEDKAWKVIDNFVELLDLV